MKPFLFLFVALAMTALAGFMGWLRDRQKS